MHSAQSCFTLPWGQGLHSAQFFFTLPWTHPSHSAQLSFRFPCGSASFPMRQTRMRERALRACLPSHRSAEALWWMEGDL